jgi:hypothetical protein
MFDASYFQSALARDVEASGGAPVVEILLRNGHVHRVRSIVEAGDGWVTLEVYSVRGDLTHERPRFGASESVHELVRTVVAYEAISGIVLDPAPTEIRTRPGFGFAAS